MKKSSDLAQQVEQAQRLLATWPDAKKSHLRLQGSDIFLSKQPQKTAGPHPMQQKNK